MSAQIYSIHPDNPQGRLIERAVQCLHRGGVIVYPTDSAYALGCHIGDKNAMERIRRIRKVDDSHNFTLVCRDLSEIATYAKVDNVSYRLIKHLTPGPYTFILPATREVPRRLQNPKRRTIGLRVPSNKIAHDLLDSLSEPLMTSTLILPGDSMPLTEAYDIHETLKHHVDMVIDGGFCGIEPTTVLDLTGEEPEVLRRGLGDIEDVMSLV